MTDTRTLRWGVLGTARIALDKVIPGLRQSPSSLVAAIASRDPARAAEAAARAGIGRAHGSYEALLADPDIDAIYNPLPNHLHVPWTIRALEAGKHVLCEKPIALDAAEASLLVDAESRTGFRVAEAFMIRHTPWWRHVRTLVADGTIGEIRAIQTFFSYALDDPDDIRNQAAIGGGGLLDIGCYAVASARFLLGREPTKVAALIDRDPAFGTDRVTSALVAFGDVPLTFTCSTGAAPTQRVVVVGRRARVEIPIPFNTPTDQPVRILVDDGSDLSGAGARTETFEPADQYALEAEDFSRAVIEDGPFEFPIADAVANMRVLDAIAASATSGTWRTI